MGVHIVNNKSTHRPTTGQKIHCLLDGLMDDQLLPELCKSGDKRDIQLPIVFGEYPQQYPETCFLFFVFLVFLLLMFFVVVVNVIIVVVVYPKQQQQQQYKYCIATASDPQIFFIVVCCWNL